MTRLHADRDSSFCEFAPEHIFSLLEICLDLDPLLLFAFGWYYHATLRFAVSLYHHRAVLLQVSARKKAEHRDIAPVRWRCSQELP